MKEKNFSNSTRFWTSPGSPGTNPISTSMALGRMYQQVTTPAMKSGPATAAKTRDHLRSFSCSPGTMNAQIW